MHKDNSSALIVEYLCHLYMERAKKLRLEKLEAWGKLEVTKTYHFEVFFFGQQICVSGHLKVPTEKEEYNS